MSPKLRVALAAIFVIVSVAVIGVAIAFAMKSPPEIFQGEIDATDVDVAAKIPGRLASVAVREGDVVTKGSLVATLESPELDARMTQASAGRDAASAQRDKAYNGARSEEVRQAEGAWMRAKHAAELAESTFRKMERLYADGVVQGQRRDEAETQWKTSRDAEAIARAAYDMALNGAREEDKKTATAMVSRAAGAVSEVEAVLGETKLVAPIDGEVSKRNAEAGETISAGYPVVTIVDLSDIWATFNVREDALPAFAMGSRIEAKVPALGGERVAMRVYYVSPQGDFATWRSTSALGGFDLKTFEVRARPEKPVAGLRPGMSVVVDRK